MKFWVMVGLFSVASIPWAAASENTSECGLDTRQPARAEATVAPLTEAREVRKAAPAARQQAENASVAQRPVVRTETPRRRSGSPRRVPDAVLIDGRGVL